MKSSVGLQENFTNPVWPIITLAIVLLIIVCIFLAIKIIEHISAGKKKVEAKKPENLPVEKDYIQIKFLYLGYMEGLEKDYKAGTISERECFQQLSSLVRGFVSDMTQRDVTKSTLMEIRIMGYKKLEALISMYYETEFAEYCQSTVDEAIEKTRQYIKDFTDGATL